jgi:hypothetical protein
LLFEFIKIDFGSAYSFPAQWNSYKNAVNAKYPSAGTFTSTASASMPASASAGEEMRGSLRGRLLVEATVAAGDGELSGATASSAPPPDYGVLGTNGISAGGFLVSPFADSPASADLQVIVYASVSTA